MIKITVIGLPAPMGSKRFVGTSKSGRGIMIESSKNVKPWREAVKYAAMEVIGRGPNTAISGPVAVSMTFTLPKPKSAPKKRRSWPDRKPDVSKLVRATEDALTDIGAWEDDARIIDLTARKVFPGEHPNALHVPGAVIEIRTVLESASV